MKFKFLKQSNESGVYYKRQDYAGLFRRLVIILFDSSLLLAFFVILFLVYSVVFEYEERLFSIYFWLCLLIAFFYLAILKPSKYRTLGYIVANVRIVDLIGSRPSFLRMAFRFCMLIASPIVFLVDILWLTGDENRQTLRDKIAAAYVIKKEAQPLGNGTQLIATYDILGYHLLLREVKRPDADLESYEKR